MNRYFSIFFILAAAAGLGCSDNNPLAPVADLVVLRGYLYAGEPVTEIQLTSTLGLGSTDTVAPAIPDAQVTLIKDQARYSLEATSGRPGYYNYPGSDLQVASGDQFRIEVSYFGKLASAETVVPAAPVELTISGSQLEVRSFSFDSIGFGFGRGFLEQDTTGLEVDWQNADGSTFYVTLDNLEADPQPVDTRFPSDRPGRIISVPIITSEYRINRIQVTHLGRYRVKVYRVNQEYADLYRSRNQDSRDLNEPLTNVANGLGVFTAFNSDSVFFQAVQP